MEQVSFERHWKVEGESLIVEATSVQKMDSDEYFREVKRIESQIESMKNNMLEMEKQLIDIKKGEELAEGLEKERQKKMDDFMKENENKESKK